MRRIVGALPRTVVFCSPDSWGHSLAALGSFAFGRPVSTCRSERTSCHAGLPLGTSPSADRLGGPSLARFSLSRPCCCSHGRGSPTLPPYNSHSSFEPSGNMDLYQPGPGLTPQRHRLGQPCHPTQDRAPLVSPSSRPLIAEDDRTWSDRNFFPVPHRLETISSCTQVGPNPVPAFKTPVRPSVLLLPSALPR
jgi:hypothetical protein